tara:strand:+ start:228 stop:1883 length:1656 start_codon:yes stop_codon:yes gene_type:complete
MQKNICFIENYRDFSLISKVDTNNTLFVPLNLETFIFCKERDYEIFDFEKNILVNFHQEALKASKEFTESLKFNLNINYSLKSEIIFFLRFRFNSIIFILEIINKIKNKYKINKIIVSGLKKNIHKNIDDANIVTEIVENLYKDEILIEKLSEPDEEKVVFHLEGYKPKIKNLNLKNGVMLNNVGYNFKKIISILNAKKIKVWVPFFNNVNIIKKIFYKLRGFNPIEFIKDGERQISKNYIRDIKFFYKSKDLSSLLNIFNQKLRYYFNDVEQRSKALKELINQNSISLTISNITKGFNGSILDKDIKCNTLCISHGIIAKSFNKYDEIYKKNIAEAVFNGESKFFAIQSKTMKNSLVTHKVKGEILETGNIVFSSIKNKNAKQYILQASTLKNFNNLQFLGVEMFYEYWSLLTILDQICKKKEFMILIKPHPTIKNYKDKLQFFFKNLKFSNRSIDYLLRKSFILISYSSSTIEDALNSEVPVILFDTKKGYKHIESGNLTNESAVYYLDDKNHLENLFSKINNMKKINFDKYIYRKNIKEEIIQILKKN